ILPGAATSNLGSFTVVNGALYFTADDGVHGVELWRSDGTAVGTALVQDVAGGSATSSPASLTNVNGVLYFTADDGVNGRKLWTTDGTAAGTQVVPNPTAPFALDPTNLAVVGKKLFYSAFS